MPLPFAGNPNFVNTLALYTFSIQNIQIIYGNLNFSFFTMQQIASIFCNVSFAGQYILNHFLRSSEFVERQQIRIY